MIRLLTLLCALWFVAPAVAHDGKLDGRYRVGATVTVKDNQVVGLSRITIVPLKQNHDDAIDINIGPLDIHIPQVGNTDAVEPTLPLCEGGICVVPPTGKCPQPCPKPVIGPDGVPQRVYMIYHPNKDKYLGVALIGGLVNWVDQADAIILPNKKAAQQQIDSLIGSRKVVELKAFLLLPVEVR